MYRCVHCLTLLGLDEFGAILPCVAHPDGSIEFVPQVEE